MSTPEPGAMFKYGIPVEDSVVDAKELRDNFEAQARTHYTTDANYPTNPRAGQLRILNDATLTPANVKLQWYQVSSGIGSWRTLLQHLESILPAPQKYVVSVTALTTVTVDHNLGSYPIVAVLNSAGYHMRLVPQGVGPGANEYTLQHVNQNRFVVTFNGATTGTVIYNG